MNLNMMQSILMGALSGFAEMLPISAEAHRTLMRCFFGVETEDAAFRLLVHMGSLVGLALRYSREIRDLRNANRLMKTPPRRRRHPVNPADGNTVKLLRSALWVMAGCRIFTLALAFLGKGLNYLVFGLTINGLLLMIPALVRSGNMTSRNMPRMLGLLMGLGGGLGTVPGISPVTGAMSLGQWQGVDRNYALKFAHLLLIPGLAIAMVFDVLDLILGGAAAFSGMGLFNCLLGGIAAGISAYWGVFASTRMAQSVGFTGFSYYSWGIALLGFVLFLMI